MYVGGRQPAGWNRLVFINKHWGIPWLVLTVNGRTRNIAEFCQAFETCGKLVGMGVGVAYSHRLGSTSLLSSSGNG